MQASLCSHPSIDADQRFGTTPRRARQCEAADLAFRQQIARDAAKRPFAQARVSVAAGDDEVDVFVLDQPLQRNGLGDLGGRHPLRDHLDAVSGEVLGDVRDMTRSLLYPCSDKQEDSVAILQSWRTLLLIRIKVAASASCHSFQDFNNDQTRTQDQCPCRSKTFSFR
jgi:hypothetical protein